MLKLLNKLKFSVIVLTLIVAGCVNYTPEKSNESETLPVPEHRQPCPYTSNGLEQLESFREKCE